MFVGQLRDFPGRNLPMLELLLDILRAAPACCWPGGDGLTLEDALSCYRQAAASGWVPGLKMLLQAHPEWRTDLIAVFGEVRSEP
jgi:hypothetical protein